MSLILHVSDFHMNKDFNKSEKRLQELTSYLKKKGLKMDYLVCTGDFIDAGEIAKKCAENIVSKYPDKFPKGYMEKKFLDELKAATIENNQVLEDYNDNIEKESKSAFFRTAEIFRDFVNRLGISDMTKVVTCCGNHDRVRKISFEKKVFKCDSGKVTDGGIEKEFSCYDDFCRDAGLLMNHHTKFHKAGGIRFLIINSNWSKEDEIKGRKSCINCKAVLDCIDNAGDKNNKMIVISHYSLENSCDEALVDYGANKKQAVRLIKNCSETFLHGHFHGSAADVIPGRNVFYCGAPFDSNIIKYNIINYDEQKGTVGSTFLCWNNDNWYTEPTDQLVEEIYRQSRQYLKPVCFDFLVGENKVPEQAENAIKKIGNEEKLQAASEVFKVCQSYKKIDDLDDKETKVSINEKNMFQWFANMVQENKDEQYPLNVRGTAGSGKSTYLGIVFCYLLSLLKKGEFPYIPFYYDFDRALEEIKFESTDCEHIYKLQIEQFEGYFKACKEITEKTIYPFCMIIDGLDEKNSLCRTEKSIEKSVYQILDNNVNDDKNRYVFSFNRYYFPGIEKLIESHSKSLRVLYVNSVSTVRFRSNKNEYEQIVNAYLDLKGMKDKENRKSFFKNITKYRMTSINLSFLHYNYSFLNGRNEENDSWNNVARYKKIVETKVENEFGKTQDLVLVSKVAFLLYQKGKTYEEINQILEKKIDYKVFNKLKQQPEAAEYLVAKHYVNEITKQRDEISEDSFLYCFITRDTAITIRYILNGNVRMIREFAINHKKELHGYLYSSLVYLAGHISNSNNLGDLNKIKSIGTKNDVAFFENCNCRSRYIAEIMTNSEPDASFDFIYKLMDDTEFRKFNRCYQLAYYGDANQGEPLGREAFGLREIDSIGKGLDFYNCFLVLTEKLQFAQEDKKRYNLLEMDLFTLCDLVYLRIQKKEDMYGNKSLFYSSEYNKKGESLAGDILKTMVELLDEYTENLNTYNPTMNRDNRIYIYFKYMKSEFGRVLRSINGNRGKDVNNLYVYPAMQLERISEIAWENKDSKRNLVQEKILETVYIALIYLPQKIERTDGPWKWYSKDKVIRLLLLRSLGRDSRPYYAPYACSFQEFNKDKEKLLSLFIMESVENTENFKEHYDLIEAEINPTTRNLDINQIIADDICTIQSRYKYYKLLFYNRLHRDDKWKKEFLEQHSQIGTDICKKIDRMLITENPKFQKFLK